MKRQYGRYALGLILLYWLGTYIYNIISAPSIDIGLAEAANTLGTNPTIHLTLVLIGAICLALSYPWARYAATLPFLWDLLGPTKIGFTGAYAGRLINTVQALISAEWYGFFLLLIGSLSSLAAITYLVREGDDTTQRTEIMYAGAVAVLFLIQLL